METKEEKRQERMNRWKPKKRELLCNQHNEPIPFDSRKKLRFHREKSHGNILSKVEIQCGSHSHFSEGAALVCAIGKN